MRCGIGRYVETPRLPPGRLRLQCTTDYVTQQELTKPVVASAVVGMVSRKPARAVSPAGISTTRQPTTPCSSSCASSAQATADPRRRADLESTTTEWASTTSKPVASASTVVERVRDRHPREQRRPPSAPMAMATTIPTRRPGDARGRSAHRACPASSGRQSSSVPSARLGWRLQAMTLPRNEDIPMHAALAALSRAASHRDSDSDPGGRPEPRHAGSVGLRRHRVPRARRHPAGLGHDAPHPPCARPGRHRRELDAERGRGRGGEAPRDDDAGRAAGDQPGAIRGRSGRSR